MPKFTCSFEDKRFHYERTITGLFNPEGDPKEVPANTENGKVAQGVS
ncbi:hypothetical protein [Flavobacterium sp. CLA17]|nr:hypothetical protein [Flavobacterium sp. CLA17]QSB25314.1 hypothetical protein HAV12_013115 [Flavobacterium sp. CLA17]